MLFDLKLGLVLLGLSLIWRMFAAHPERAFDLAEWIFPAKVSTVYQPPRHYFLK